MLQIKPCIRFVEESALLSHPIGATSLFLNQSLASKFSKGVVLVDSVPSVPSASCAPMSRDCTRKSCRLALASASHAPAATRAACSSSSTARCSLVCSLLCGCRARCRPPPAARWSVRRRVKRFRSSVARALAAPARESSHHADSSRWGTRGERGGPTRRLTWQWGAGTRSEVTGELLASDVDVGAR